MIRVLNYYNSRDYTNEIAKAELTFSEANKIHDVTIGKCISIISIIGQYYKCILGLVLFYITSYSSHNIFFS